MDVNEFARKHRVKMTPTLVGSNPNMDDMPEGSTHWRCELRRSLPDVWQPGARGPTAPRVVRLRRTLTTYFSMGPAHCKEPTTEDLLDCLASDACTIENAPTFEEFARDLGYDEDSRKAERIFKVCQKQTEKLRQFLGDDTFALLVFDTERL